MFNRHSSNGFKSDEELVGDALRRVYRPVTSRDDVRLADLLDQLRKSETDPRQPR